MKAEGRKAPSTVPPATDCGGWAWRTRTETRTGTPSRYAAVFSQQFFDDLCDYFESYEDVRGLISGLSESAEDAAGKQKFLLVCLQYDAIYRSLPDPVWWISGNPAAAELFAEGFIAHLKQLDQSK